MSSVLTSLKKMLELRYRSKASHTMKNKNSSLNPKFGVKSMAMAMDRAWTTHCYVRIGAPARGLEGGILIQ